MAYYSRQITEPATRLEGITNHLQMVINRLEAGDEREALLTAVDLLDRLSGYEGREMFPENKPDLNTMPISEHLAAMKATKADAYKAGFDAGQRAKQAEFRKLLGEVA